MMLRAQIVATLRPLLMTCLLLGGNCKGAEEPNLLYEIRGLTGEPLENATAYLGDLPDTSYERNYFLFSVEQRVRDSLNALGYYHSRIELELDREQPVWQLTIEVQQGDRVEVTAVDFRVEGEAAVDEAFVQLATESPLVVGQGLHHGTYETFKSQLLSLGRDRGYFEASLARSSVSVDVDTNEAVIELVYVSGPRFRFGDVSFDDYPLNRRVLNQLMPFAAGDWFDIEKLQALQADLQNTEYFGSALVQPLQLKSDDKTLPVHVKLEPGDRHHFRAGLGFSTDTRERISLSWRTPRINRYGHRQTSLIEYSPVRPRARVNYGIPLSHPLNDTLQLSARLESNEYGSLESFQQELAVRRDMKEGDWILSLGLRRLWEDWDVGAAERSNNYLLPGITVAHTSRGGNPLDPTFGFSQIYELEVGEDRAGSDISLQRVYANWRAVLSLGERHRLVGRAELGAVNFSDGSRPDLAPSLSFFAGGSQSIRGYAYQSLGPTEEILLPGGEVKSLVIGGDRLAVASAEYQYYITDEIRGAVFVDAGNAFNGNHFNAVAGAGFGVHYVSPVGAVRIDLGNPVTEDRGDWRVHITMGAEF